MPLRAQNKPLLLEELCNLLDRVAVLYQVQNYSSKVNGLLLAEWLMDEYQHHEFELIKMALNNPPPLQEQAWRLTPDTLRSWIDYTRIKREEKRIAEESTKRQNQEVRIEKQEWTEETQKLVREFTTKLEAAARPVPTLHKSQIQKEGQERVKKTSASAGHSYTTAEEYTLKELHRQYLHAKWKHDEHQRVMYNGKIKETFMSEEEWMAQ